MTPRMGLSRGPGAFFSGVGAVLFGLRRILGEPALRRLAVVPVLLALGAYLVVGAAGIYFSGDLLEWIWHRPDGWLQALWYLALVLLVAALGVVGVLLFTTVAETLGGPFYDRMAAAVFTEHGLASKEPSFLTGTVFDLFRSFTFLVPALVFGLLGLIPVVGVPFWVLAFAFAWLGLASSAFNPSLLVTGHGLSARTAFVFRYFFVSLGIGAVVGLAAMVPLLGLIAIPASIVGATELFAQTRLRGLE